MKTFSLTLIDTAETVRFEKIVQMIAADAEGSFGILAGHAHTVALLRYGLLRFIDDKGIWHYLALPGGVLRFTGNELIITTVRYFLGDDRDAIRASLEAAMQQTDSEVNKSRAALSEIEHSLVRRLAELSNPRTVGVERLEARLDAATDMVALDATGNFNDAPWDLAGRPGTLDRLYEFRDVTHDVSGHVGKTRLALRSRIRDPMRLGDPEVEAELAGPDLAAALATVGLRSPVSGPFEARGRFSPADGGVELDLAAGVSGAKATVRGRVGRILGLDAIDATGGARQLADSLYAELYGLRERQGVRQSLFRYFHGRSRLATGRSQSASLTVRIDLTAPVVAYAGNASVYLVDQVIAIVCSASDALSGIAPTTCQDITGPAYTFAPGANTFSATASDVAGNPGSGSTSFTVLVTFGGLCSITRQFSDSPELAHSVCALLTAAEATRQQGENPAAAQILLQYEHQVAVVWTAPSPWRRHGPSSGWQRIPRRSDGHICPDAHAGDGPLCPPLDPLAGGILHTRLRMQSTAQGPHGCHMHSHAGDFPVDAIIPSPLSARCAKRPKMRAA